MHCKVRGAFVLIIFPTLVLCKKHSIAPCTKVSQIVASEIGLFPQLKWKYC